MLNLNSNINQKAMDAYIQKLENHKNSFVVDTVYEQSYLEIIDSAISGLKEQREPYLVLELMNALIHDFVTNPSMSAQGYTDAAITVELLFNDTAQELNFEC